MSQNPDHSSLGDQAALLTLGRLAERIVGILSGVFLVRLLSKSDYGTFLQVSLIGSLAASLILLGLPQSLLYFVPREPSRGRRRFIFQTAMITFGASSLAAGLICVAHRPIARLLHNDDLEAMGLIVGLYVLAYSLDRLVEPALISIQQARLAGLLTAISSFLLLLSTLVPARAGWGIGVVYVCIILVYVGRLAYLFAVVTPLEGPATGSIFDRSSIKKQLKFSIPLGLAGISGLYNRQLDSLLVSFFFVPAVYAVYSRGAFELPLIDLLPFTLAMVILPRLVELWQAGRTDEFTSLWNRAIQISSLVVFPAFAYGLLFARELIVVLFTENYAGSVTVFVVYLLALPFRLTSYGVLLQAIGDTRTILRSSLLGLVLNGAVALALCPVLGPVGAATGYVASQVFQIVYLLDAIRRKASVPARRLLPWSKLGVALAIAMLAAVGVRVGSLVLDHPLARLMVTGPTFGCLCLAGYLAAGLIGREERAMVKRWSTLAVAAILPQVAQSDGGPHTPAGGRHGT